MKSFTERNPIRVGGIVLAAMAVIIAAVIFLNRSFFESGYPVEARFSNAGGIGKGTNVLMAGVKIGSVDSVQIDGNSVLAKMTIDNGVVLPKHTAAAIQVQTLLGVLDVAMEPVSGWRTPMRPGSLITDTSVSTEIYQLQNTAGHLLQQTDATALNNVIQDLASITQGKQQQVAEIIEGLGKLTTTIDQRSGEVSQLIDSANVVSSTLADHDQQLVSVIDNLNTVAAGLANHSSDLGNLIDNIDSMAAQTSSLVGQNQPQLNGLLKNLHSVLNVVSQHQDDLAEGLSYLASGVKGFASIAYAGTTPTPWANAYANPATVTNTYGLIGPCQGLDQALNQILGPDPLPCDQQTGPLPGSGSTQPPGSSTSGTQGSSAAPSSTGSSSSSSTSSGPGGGQGAASGGAAAAAAPNSGLGALNELLSPLTEGGP